MIRFATEEQMGPEAQPGHRRWRRALLSVAGLTLVSVIAASCSSSSATPTTNSGAGGTTAALVSTTKNAKLGTILVDNKGFVLYTLSGNAPCDSSCSAVWPPLMVSGSATPNLGGVSGLGTVKVSGGEQVTHDGMRLYTFVQDKTPGDATGQGLTDTWGTWSAVVTQTSTSPPASTTPTTGATTTTTAGGGGGGVGF